MLFVESSRKSKVRKLEMAITINENIVWFNIAIDEFVNMVSSEAQLGSEHTDV